MRTDTAYTMVSNTPQGQELEVYSRVQPRRTPPLLFQMGYRYSEVTRAGRNLWLDFAPMVLGALLLLQLLQFPLAWDLARRLRRSHEERERLLRSAIEASNSERRRIASDLHDGTVQDLAGVSLELSAASRRMTRTLSPGGVVVAERPDGEVLEAAARRVRSAVRSLRTLLVEIYPPNLEETGLEQALTDLTARLTERGITPHLDITLPARPLPSDTVTLLYRCGQELVRNVARHSGASSVEIRVAPDDAGMMVMEVTDDGRGFAPETALTAPGSGHVGLRVMADLVGEAGGVVELASAPGKGTHLLVRVPA
jgi:signal transduction histidine kinase